MLKLVIGFQVEWEVGVVVEYIWLFEVVVEDLLEMDGIVGILNDKLRSYPNLYQMVGLYRVAILRDRRHLREVCEVKHILEQMEEGEEIVGVLG